MNNENRKIVGYDPNTGQPIYEVLDYQSNSIKQSDTIKVNVEKNKEKFYIKLLLITNIITLIILICFVCMFVLKGDNKSNTITEPKEDNNYTSTATTNPVSKNWMDYQFSIGGKTLALPCSYKELKDISGFFMKSSDEKSYLENHSSTNVNLYIKGDKEEKLSMYIDIKNDTDNDLSYLDSQVVRIDQTEYQVKTNNVKMITFPGELTVGLEKTKEDIINLLGEPSNIREYNSDNYSSITLTYNADEIYNTINYYQIIITNGEITELSLDHKKY